ncbi:hypothetical protein N7540_012564 [Penicillium herquei]|nr:hypothetical protein N7540_012564 [Penicillium herquei]
MRYDRVASSEDEEDVQLKGTAQNPTTPHPYINGQGYQRWCLLGFAAIQSVVIVILSVLVIVMTGRTSSLQADQTHRSTPMVYGYDRPYMSLNHTYDHLWNETSNSGLVYTEVEGDEEVGAIAMFHQLHCLVAMRAAMQNAAEGKDIGIDQTEDRHWPHCFDYLRKTLHCFADDTIEYQDVDDEGEKLPHISGYQTSRQCRSAQAQALYDYRATHQYINPPRDP